MSRQTDIVADSPAGVERAAALLRGGELVAFPTETVYGLGADATDDRAVAAIFETKGRPQFNPLIVHCADAEMARRLVVFDERADLLAETCWPGPLTLVLPRRPDSGLSLLVSAGLDSVAVRMPAHPTAHRLLAATGRPVAAPSANRSGAVSPTTAAHVQESLGGRIPLILAAGRCEIGLESTVLDLTGDAPALLRPGGATREEIKALIGPVRLPDADPERPLSPGQLSSHYAPRAGVRLNAQTVEAGEALLTFGPDLRKGERMLNLSETGDLAEAAANLFAHLRALDRTGATTIAVAPIPEEGLGMAINDRLRRAAAPRPGA
ncbi:L-threonylcarbamoyladenylate synthase [Inquilinus sp. CAU 1745]|uniref:L-threonylcarbamoyladenylate synthase n=1 Tax=Inquilinus sp. CAU 1745 TaxID=3140369 RepID=UPI00325B15F9